MGLLRSYPGKSRFAVLRYGANLDDIAAAGRAVADGLPPPGVGAEEPAQHPGFPAFAGLATGSAPGGDPAASVTGIRSSKSGANVQSQSRTGSSP
jgi:hypothetical protein